MAVERAVDSHIAHTKRISENWQGRTDPGAAIVAALVAAPRRVAAVRPSAPRIAGAAVDVAVVLAPVVVRLCPSAPRCTASSSSSVINRTSVQGFQYSLRLQAVDPRELAQASLPASGTQHVGNVRHAQWDHFEDSVVPCLTYGGSRSAPGYVGPPSSCGSPVTCLAISPSACFARCIRGCPSVVSAPASSVTVLSAC